MTRHDELSGAANFRDLGGYAGLDGRRVRARRLFRSDHLGALTADDAQRMRGLRVARVLDLRGVNERAAQPCAVSEVTVHSLSIEPTIVQRIAGLVSVGERLTQQDVGALMQETYRGFVRNSTHRFAELFEHMLREDDTALVFHCTAGKDRTGFAAALIHLSLGVSYEDTLRDYMLTNERQSRQLPSWQGLTPELVEPLYWVRPAFLEASFDAIREDYGGVDAYLREGLALGPAQRERLAELYLEP